MLSIVFGLLLIVAVKCQDVVDPDYYTAAIHEHMVKGDYKTDTAKNFIEKNLAFYEISASTAGQHNADLLVFPEYGLYPFKNREDLIDDAQYVPDPQSEQWNPCLEPDRYNNSYVLANLSCMAKQNNIVILANILSKMPCNDSSSCPEDKFYLYNTNVAFNRSGLLIARYRKTHLHYEDDINVLPKPEFIVFQTDFAKIGTFICFDIIWKESVEMVEKLKPDTVIFSTLWFEFFLPMSSVQIQQAWGIANNVTFVTSNRQQPNYGAQGSGVFFGDTGIGNYVYISDGQSRLLISKVPKKGVNPPQEFPPPTIIEFGDFQPGKSDNNISSGVCSTKILGPTLNKNNFRCITDYDFSNFTLVKVNATNQVEACNNGLCCSADYIAELSDEDYYLAVFNGLHTSSERYTWWIEVCALVRCDPFEGKPCSMFPTISKTVFQELKIKANFTTSYVYPSISISGLQLPPKKNWVYNENEMYFKAENDSLLFATLYGRSYDKDPK